MGTGGVQARRGTPKLGEFSFFIRYLDNVVGTAVVRDPVAMDDAAVVMARSKGATKNTSKSALCLEKSGIFPTIFDEERPGLLYRTSLVLLRTKVTHLYQRSEVMMKLVSFQKESSSLSSSGARKAKTSRSQRIVGRYVNLSFSREATIYCR